MVDFPSRPLNIICLASYFKGGDFLRECKASGARVTLVTRETLRDEDWPRESIADFITLPTQITIEALIESLSLYARERAIDRIVALEEYDVLTAAAAREHFNVKGMGATLARNFRDKLTMRAKAHEMAVRVPAFIHPVNHEMIAEFIHDVPAPWMLKPRADVSAVGMRKLYEAAEVWQALEELDAGEEPRDRATHFLLERFIGGTVYHVDSLVKDGDVVFAAVNRYGRAPFEVAHQGGVFLSSSIKRGSDDEKQLMEINRRLLAGLGLSYGAAHAEFIRGERDGQLYFLEVAARVGGAYIAETIEAATGINLWREWARLESNDPYRDPARLRQNYSGIALSLARQEMPDTSAYNDAEIVYRVCKSHHVGLIVSSPSLERVEELINDYAQRFARDYCAVLPPLERPQ